MHTHASKLASGMVSDKHIGCMRLRILSMPETMLLLLLPGNLGIPMVGAEVVEEAEAEAAAEVVGVQMSILSILAACLLPILR